ncbi:GSCOCG00004337001-RA-CDS [Cotesia congregata]|uniref:Mitotic checkpoint protein BUB3 n=1 Tax=Cotesia congregata TaxID=51543 RepID=A0A8J2EDV8_COTCN|nr:mitotic checkpoint protein BUB3 [Cotesia glomerata]CAD6216121.1 GSCOCG00004337001-RA-CDS [Cotesia congregata]CAG5075576.1 Similar to bub3: Mitotic checkpoint protein BUB3 (Xenopus laevis) [Cotesia congregata]
MESRTEFKIKNPPSDAISAVEFGPNSTQFLLVSSWDSTVRLYDIHANSMRLKYNHDQPVLDVAFQDAVHAYSGGLGCTLKMYDINANAETIMGSHEKAIRKIEYCSSVNAILTGGWDAAVKLWDPRTPTCVGTYLQPDTVLALSVCGDKFVVGTAKRKVCIWDLRNMAGMFQRRESSLKYQTRCIKGFPNEQGYVLSSIEGRVAVEYLDTTPEAQKKKYAFKCHRIKENGIENIYPVNAISFHTTYNTFATGGSDGYVNIWDGFNKKRLCQFHKYNAGVAALSFSHDGSVLAIGVSFLDPAEITPVVHDEKEIYIRYVNDQETKPK